MVNIFGVWTLPEMPFLEELADELEGTFLMIIGAGYANNLDFIKERQKYFREKYGSQLEHCLTDVATFHIEPAYWALQNILEGPYIEETFPPEDIIDTASNALYEHLIVEIDNEEYHQHCDVFAGWN